MGWITVRFSCYNRFFGFDFFFLWWWFFSLYRHRTSRNFLFFFHCRIWRFIWYPLFCPFTFRWLWWGRRTGPASSIKLNFQNIHIHITKRIISLIQTINFKLDIIIVLGMHNLCFFINEELWLQNIETFCVKVSVLKCLRDFQNLILYGSG